MRVALAPERALYLFTPAGERLWADGWDPAFPRGESGDGGEPGTVFVTEAHGRSTIWVVVERTEDTVRYTRTTPGHLAGTVTARLQKADDGTTVAEVTYDLTALTPEAEPALAAFERNYDDFLADWERAIAEALAAGRIS